MNFKTDLTVLNTYEVLHYDQGRQ